MSDSLRTLNEFGVPIRSVIDVGVQGGTRPLMQAFPHLKHLLFEPVDSYFDVIKDAYRDHSFELLHIALSEKDGDAWQVGISRDGSGAVTHSQLSDRPISRQEEPRLVECKRVRQARLDSVLRELEIPTPYLIKIDVDGQELPILRGAAQSLAEASVVVIEAPLTTILPRAEFILGRRFQLFDIVDLSYYYGMLSQVDLIFIGQDIVDQNPDLRPWETRQFSWDEYLPLDEDFYKVNLAPGREPLSES